MPSSKNYKRDYKQEYASESDTRRSQRAARNRARYAVEKKVGPAAMQGKDVGHVQALSRGGTNSLSNLQLQDPHLNQSFARNSKGAMVSETSKRERKKK